MIIDCFSQNGPRDKNEDFIIVDEPKFVFVVCDGMGGHDGGEIASKTVAETIVNHWSNDMDEVCQNAAANSMKLPGTLIWAQQWLSLLYRILMQRWLIAAIAVSTWSEREN